RDDAGAIDKVILPIHGYGLWSTLYGFIALEENGNDIYALQFYEHAETPGLGAEVDNPRWKALWHGKRLVDDEGELQINVSKKPTAAGEDYHVDALSGATLTTVGVHNLVNFWMGEAGYRGFLENLKAGIIS
ncbi:MAG: NADH:ubiquinone reductase (Na(+)-transporting) subunit C, partial [Pseudomonadota bacterium]